MLSGNDVLPRRSYLSNFLIELFRALILKRNHLAIQTHLIKKNYPSANEARDLSSIVVSLALFDGDCATFCLYAVS